MRRQLAALVLALSLPWPAQAAQVVVRPGETLSEIAARAGISTQRLMQINGLRDADHIVAGQRLTVPSATQPSSGGTRGSGQVPGRITIRQGETLSEIAQRYGVSVERLMQLNGLSDPSRVVAGDALVLRAPTSPRRSGGGGAGGTTVVVRPGETLSEIADRHNVSVERLVQLNGIQNPSQLMAGDRLVISSQPPARTSRSRTSGGAGVYVVQPGDTLSEIASDTRVPIERLLSLNKLQDPDDLTVGTRLKLTSPPPVPRSRPSTSTRPRPRVTTPTVSTPSVARTPATPTRNTASTAAATPRIVPTATTTASRTATGSSTTPTPTPTRTTPLRTTASPTGSGASLATTTSPATADPGATTSVALTPTTTTPTITATPTRTATTTTTPSTTTTTSTLATASSRPTGGGSTPRSTAPRTSRRPGVVTPDWRTYGPLQVDWASWQSMGGSYVAPVLGSGGQPYYLAINCGARKLNTTAASGQWKTWESPSSDTETSLVNDLCKLKGG